MTHLPHPKDSGEKFAKDLDMFCQEFSPTMQGLKHLLLLKLGATDWHKIRPHFPTGNAQTKNADWNHADDKAYRQAVETLCQRIKTFQSEWTPPKSSGRGRGRRQSQTDPDLCFYCWERGHWKISLSTFDQPNGGWTRESWGKLTTETFTAEAGEGGGSRDQSPPRPRSTNR